MVFCFIVLDAFLVVGFLVIRDATSINNLKKEINELTKLDITKDDFQAYITLKKFNKTFLCNFS